MQEGSVADSIVTDIAQRRVKGKTKEIWEKTTKV